MSCHESSGAGAARGLHGSRGPYPLAQRITQRLERLKDLGEVPGATTQAPESSLRASACTRCARSRSVARAGQRAPQDGRGLLPVHGDARPNRGGVFGGGHLRRIPASANPITELEKRPKKGPWKQYLEASFGSRKVFRSRTSPEIRAKHGAEVVPPEWAMTLHSYSARLLRCRERKGDANHARCVDPILLIAPGQVV